MPLARRREPELMDDPLLDAARHRDALRGLARLNALARTDGAIWALTERVAARNARPPRFLDVASGSGDLLVRLARRARAAKTEAEFTACDISATALKCASAAAARAKVKIRTVCQDILRTPLHEEFDIAHAGLFFHHLDPTEVEAVLRRMAAAAPVIIVQDLRRTYAGLALAATIPRLVTQSEIVHTDALLSVRAAYTIDEMRRMAEQAGLKGATVVPLWPQRMLLHWERAV